MKAEQNKPSRASAILHLRCPRCLKGQVFTGTFAMNDRCPECNYRFGREDGYFIGSMYISYGVSFFFMCFAVGVLWWQFLRDWNLLLIIGLATLCMLPFVPMIFRYSRILWMHFDLAIDPEPEFPAR